MLDAHAALLDLSNQIAAAISHRDVAKLRRHLAPGFTHRTHGGESVDTEKFLSAIDGIPGDILSVELEAVTVDPTPTGALVTGVQSARVVVDGQTIDDRRGFVDWFTELDGEWKLQAAVDLPVLPV